MDMIKTAFLPHEYHEIVPKSSSTLQVSIKKPPKVSKSETSSNTGLDKNSASFNFTIDLHLKKVIAIVSTYPNHRSLEFGLEEF